MNKRTFHFRLKTCLGLVLKLVFNFHMKIKSTCQYKEEEVLKISLYNYIFQNNSRP